jgi:hypothetical protein
MILIKVPKYGIPLHSLDEDGLFRLLFVGSESSPLDGPRTIKVAMKEDALAALRST